MSRGLANRARGVLVSGVLASTALASACGGTREYSGARLTPDPPVVATVELPELTNDGVPRPLTASPGHLQLVYFGYTSCPDFCPRTMSDLAAARNRVKRPELIEVAMVTIDPGRDLDNLAEYVHAFFPDGRAFGTDDPNLLANAAAPFGVAYSVTADADDPDASPVVSHTTSVFAVDDAGRLVLTWPYGTPIEDLTADLDQYSAEELIR